MKMMIRCLISTLAFFGVIMLVGVILLLAYLLLRVLIIGFIIWLVLVVIYYGFKELYYDNDIQKNLVKIP